MSVVKAKSRNSRVVKEFKGGEGKIKVVKEFEGGEGQIEGGEGIRGWLRQN